MDTVHENNVEQVPAWKKEGLLGIPTIETPPNKMHSVPLDTLIRDDMGKIITAPRYDNVQEIMSEHLGKTIEAVKMIPAPGMGEFLDTVAFRCTGNGRLSLLERRAVATLAWMAIHYYAPMKRRDKTVFPTVLDNLPKELQSTSRYIPMWKSFTENKAVQVADVLEMMFPDVMATVFEDGDGWFVRIDAKEIDFEDAATLERVETIMWLLSDFDVVPNEQGMRIYGAGFMSDLDMDEHIHRRSIRAFDAYAAQQRIEDGINAILARLGDVGTAGKAKVPLPAKTSDKAVDVIVEGDRHILPAKPAGKKSSAKRSA